LAELLGQGIGWPPSPVPKQANRKHETRAHISVPSGDQNRYPSARSVKKAHASEDAAQCDRHDNHALLIKTTAFETHRLQVDAHALKLNNVLKLNHKYLPCKTATAGLRAYKCLKNDVVPVCQHIQNIHNSLNLPIK
jgi:hypothetical protein